MLVYKAQFQYYVLDYCLLLVYDAIEQIQKDFRVRATIHRRNRKYAFAQALSNACHRFDNYKSMLCPFEIINGKVSFWQHYAINNNYGVQAKNFD